MKNGAMENQVPKKRKFENFVTYLHIIYEKCKFTELKNKKEKEGVEIN